MADKNSKELEPGAMICEAGNAKQYQTGDWRSNRPEVDKEKCTNCLFCWIFCPDSCILVQDEKMTGFDLDHCKGCGICAEICPAGAIEMQPEAQHGVCEVDAAEAFEEAGTSDTADTSQEVGR